jgi:malate permease and related proteins
MFMAILNTIAPVIVCALIGFSWARLGGRYETVFVTQLVTNVGFPCLIFVTLIKVELDSDILLLMGVSALVTTAVFAAISGLVLKAVNLDIRAFLPSMTFANTGNLGLSLCLLAFGSDGLAMGIGFFTVSAILVHVFGAAISSGNYRLDTVLKVPLVWATLAAVVAMWSDVELPEWIMRSLDMLGSFAIPLMLITLGVSLADLKVDSLRRSTALSVLRLGMGFAVGLVAAELLALDGAARGVMIIQCTMPAAVFNFMYAQMYDARPTEVAGVIMVSTLLSFLTLPALMWFVMGG